MFLHSRIALRNSTRRCVSQGVRRYALTSYHQRQQTQTRAGLRRLIHVDSVWPAYSATYVDDMYAAWQKDPSSVHHTWQEYFSAMETGRSPSPIQSIEPALSAGVVVTPPHNHGSTTPAGDTPVRSAPGSDTDEAKLQRLVRAYQAYGHYKAKTNPLNLPGKKHPIPDELHPEFYGFKDADLSRSFALGPVVLPQFASAHPTLPLHEILQICEQVYCGSIGAEYQHIPARREREWIQARLETPSPYRFSSVEKRRILDRLVWATAFERFMTSKFPNAKRFSIEGVETQIPALKAVIDASAKHGVRDVIFASCHRGKLNVLSNVARKPNELIFSEFASDAKSRHPMISGDVKYHLGMNSVRETPSAKKVNMVSLPNPSHLESQNTLAQGMARALQQAKGGETASTMVLNNHTDASFSGQGVIYETLGLSGLKSYSTGG